MALYSRGDVILSTAERYDISVINNDKYLFQNNLHTLLDSERSLAEQGNFE